MANVVITIKIMPTSPDVDLEAIKEKAKEKLSAFNAHIGSVEEEPIAFGLKAIKIIFLVPETQNPDVIEDSLKEIENVESVEIIDVRRAVG